MTLKKYHLVLFFIITFFCIFDGMRSNIVYNQIISPLKELAIVLCFIECIKLKRIKYKYILGLPLLLLFIYHILVFIFSIFQIDALSLSNTILMGFKFSLIYMACIVYYYFEELTGKPYSLILRWIIYLGVFYTVLNIISVFKTLPIWINNDIWFGRFSKGYPTSDTISLCFMLLVSLFNVLHYTSRVRISLILISIVSIIMQNTGSGLILVPFIILIYLLGQCYDKKMKNVFVLIISSLIAIVIVGKFVTTMNHSLAQKVEDSYIVFQAKVDNFVKGEETDKFNSIGARKEQEKEATKFIGSDFGRIFGIGFSHFTMNEKLMNSRAFSIENMTSNIKIIYGYVGYVLYWLSIISFLIFIYKWKTSIQIKLFYVCGMAIFVVGSQALVSFYLIQVYGIFAITVSMLKRHINFG